MYTATKYLTNDNEAITNLLLASDLFAISKCNFTVKLKQLKLPTLHFHGSLARPLKELEIDVFRRVMHIVKSEK